MKKTTTFSFGKIDGYNNGRKTCEVKVKMDLTTKTAGEETYEAFSASAEVWNQIHTDIIMGGQCIDTLYREYASLRNDALFKEIHDLWKAYHLNDMKAGTPKQEVAIKEFLESRKDAPYEERNYDAQVAYLKEKGLLYDTLPNGESYKYGSRWLFEKIPEEDLRKIKDIMENGREAECIKAKDRISFQEWESDSIQFGIFTTEDGKTDFTIDVYPPEDEKRKALRVLADCKTKQPKEWQFVLTFPEMELEDGCTQIIPYADLVVKNLFSGKTYPCEGLSKDEVMQEDLYEAFLPVVENMIDKAKEHGYDFADDTVYRDGQIEPMEKEEEDMER